MLDLARRGAEVRLRELAREARQLLAVFPHLGDSFDPDELPVPFLLAEGARQNTAEFADLTRGASAGGRRGGRRKKDWAERRKTKARS